MSRRLAEGDFTLSPEEWIENGRRVLDIEVEGLRAVRDALDDSFARALEIMAGCRGRVVVCGIGKSGLVGRKIAATLSSTGTAAYFLHPVEGAHGDMGMLRPEDVCLAISYSGETDELNAILPTLRSLGIQVVGITGVSDSTMASLCDVVLTARVPREACPFGLAPTASTTAALALGDALAVSMISIKAFDVGDFRRNHPGGALGQRLARRIGDLMHKDGLPVVHPDRSLEEALTILNHGGLGAVLVADEDVRLQGIVTDGDIRRLVCSGGLQLERPVGEVMIRNPLTGEEGESSARILDVMESRTITVLPIVDKEGHVRGLVHIHDLLGKGRFRFSG
ncbi:MAG: KpsF/GutQ family sugar-phosphate isomerase [Deltaproteobacteria bacterium]|nr:KpsF/GutQ family sugar-phosphate isomerase [Deltaproteobacteria bacterium]